MRFTAPLATAIAKLKWADIKVALNNLSFRRPQKPSLLSVSLSDPGVRTPALLPRARASASLQHSHGPDAGDPPEGQEGGQQGQVAPHAGSAGEERSRDWSHEPPSQPASRPLSPRCLPSSSPLLSLW